MGPEVGASEAGYSSFLREFLYVDVGRIRSYLAQLTEGLPERITEAAEHVSTTDTGVKVSGVGVDRIASRTARWEETRTYGDLLVPLFEEHATVAGFLTDITGDIENVEDWESGQTHERFEPGSLFRWTGLVRLFDATYMADSVRRFEDMVDAIVKLMPSQQPKGAGDKPGRTTQSPKAKATGIDARGLKRQTEPIRILLQNLLAGGIGLRLLPCGPEKPECGFGGTLLDRSDYIEPERAAVFSRYGFEPAPWTVIGRVSRVSKRSNSSEIERLDPGGVLSGAQERIDRGRFEELALEVLLKFEASGLTESPVWPSIGITPLAVYRTVASTIPSPGQ